MAATTKMTAKEYLSRGLELNGLLHKKRERLEAIRDLAERATSVNLSFTPGGTDVSKPVENAVVRIVEAEDEIGKLSARLESVKTEIADAIQRLDNPTQIKLLAMRFVSFMEWRDVVDELGYSRRHVFRLRDEAFELLGNFAA